MADTSQSFEKTPNGSRSDTMYVIVSDFDGTITLQDTTDVLVKVCGNAENDQIEVEYISGSLDNREAMARHFEIMNIGLDEYLSVVDDNIRVDPWFDTFLTHVKNTKTPFHIVSGGFIQGIRRVLGEARLEGVEVHANKLTGQDSLRTSFITKHPVCDKPYGPCGNCKRDYIKEIHGRTDRTLVFIGDGLTDRCAIEGADILLAKSALASYCDDQGISYVPFNDFADVIRRLWPEDL